MNDKENLNTSLIDEFSVPISEKCKTILKIIKIKI